MKTFGQKATANDRTHFEKHFTLIQLYYRPNLKFVFVRICDFDCQVNIAKFWEGIRFVITVKIVGNKKKNCGQKPTCTAATDRKHFEKQTHLGKVWFKVKRHMFFCKHFLIYEA